MLPNLPFGRLISSRQLISGDHINHIGDLLTSFAGSLVALAGGGLSALTPVFNAAFNEVTTVATINDSYALPIAKVGLIITVTNSGAATMNIFANSALPDTISGAASETQATGVCVEYICTKTGIWKRSTIA